MQRKINFIGAVILLFIFGAAAASCADKFLAARIAVNIGRAATATADSAFRLAEKSYHDNCVAQICLKVDPTKGAAYKTCMTADHSAEDAYKVCMVKVVRATAVWAKTHGLADALWDEADALINAAEQADTGQTLDWMTPLRGAACLVARGLDFLPDATKAKIATILAMMKGFGCPAP